MSQADGVWADGVWESPGRRAPDAADILARLPASTHPFATLALAGVLKTHLQETSDWLATNIGTPASPDSRYRSLMSFPPGKN